MKKFFIYFTLFIITIAAIFMIAYHNNLYVWENPKQNIWIANGQLFDGTSEQVRDNPGILIKDGKIVCIGSNCQIPTEVKRIDATGKAIVPGLIDLHGHFLSGKARDPEQGIPSMIWQQLRYLPSVRRELIAAGVTSYRSLGDVMPAILDLKKELSEQNIAGPRLFIAGPIFTVKGGHPTQGKGIPTWVVERMTIQSDDPSYVKQQVAILAEQGIDGIKVIYQGSTNEKGVVTMPRISSDTLLALTSEARKHGLWVAVHTGSPEETDEAIAAGINTIEHGIRHGNLINSTTLQSIVENNIVYVPTLGREPQGHLNIAALNQSGVVFGVGTDSPVEMADGNSYHNELSRMVNAGIPDVKVLIAATRNGADALGKLAELGTIEVGKYADLLIVNGQPWQDIRELKKINIVILSGRIALDNSTEPLAY
ncbi:amidohydrolase family protein [Colwellia piezophila]|uniref:amidohydrolase family protein n=1 Tax=Colwellia piezophila TaxID=211668 RepID=UPI0003A269DA|nr:amidohydrolase family protein [Colwellia piezophila]